MTSTARYAVVSSVGLAGADLYDYKDYRASSWHDDFDAWAPTYVNPYADLQAPTAYRSWDSSRRLEETEADGITAEVLFPNTVPPFFESSQLTALPPTPADYDRRWASPQPLAGRLLQEDPRARRRVPVFANDIDDAVGALEPRGCSPAACCCHSACPAWNPTTTRSGRLPKLVARPGARRRRPLPTTANTSRRGAMLIELPWFAHPRSGTSSTAACSSASPTCAWC